MKKIVTYFITVLMLVLSTSSVYAGAAICIAKKETPRGHETDAEYFIHWDSSNKGYGSEKNVQQAYKSKYNGIPSCRSTGNLINGYFVIISFAGTNYDGEPKLTYAFGYGLSQEEAQQDAIKELGRRNWSWRKSQGYKVEEIQEF